MNDPDIESLLEQIKQTSGPSTSVRTTIYEQTQVPFSTDDDAGSIYYKNDDTPQNERNQICTSPARKTMVEKVRALSSLQARLLLYGIISQWEHLPSDNILVYNDAPRNSHLLHRWSKDNELIICILRTHPRVVEYLNCDDIRPSVLDKAKQLSIVHDLMC